MGTEIIQIEIAGISMKTSWNQEYFLVQSYFQAFVFDKTLIDFICILNVHNAFL